MVKKIELIIMVHIGSHDDVDGADHDGKGINYNDCGSIVMIKVH